jgi:hypothetical protein
VVGIFTVLPLRLATRHSNDTTGKLLRLNAPVHIHRQRDTQHFSVVLLPGRDCVVSSDVNPSLNVTAVLCDWRPFVVQRRFSSNEVHIASNDRVISDWWNGKELECRDVILRYYPRINIEGLRKTAKNLDRITCLRADIWTRDLLKTKAGLSTTHHYVRWKPL